MELFAKKIEKQLASYQQELIETHYREVDNMYRQIRGWRHDYRNHIQTMKAYAAAGDWDAIQNYLDLLDTDLQTVDTVIKTGNPMTGGCPHPRPAEVLGDRSLLHPRQSLRQRH